MRQFELLNKLLAEGGYKPVVEIKKNLSESASQEAEAPKAPSASSRLKESDLLSAEVDELVESAMRDTLKTTIREGGIDPKALDLVEDATFTETEMLSFMEDTINPILETVTGYDRTRMFRAEDKNRVKGVHLPIYEIALTLESARLGALTMESLDDVPVKEDVDPDAQDLESIVDQSIDQTYNFGKLTNDPLKEQAANTVKKLTDVHQYEDNESRMYELLGPGRVKGSAPSQAQTHEGEPNFKSVSDIKGAEGDVAGDGDGPLFKRPMGETVIGRIRKSLVSEMMGSEIGRDVEKMPSSVKDIKGYEGEEAGTPGPGENASGELTGDGSADEAIVEQSVEDIIEQQTIIAKHLLGRIFAEYGVTDKERQATMVREAVHYIFKYGTKNLYPAVSDVSQLVTEQNSWADLEGDYSARFIIDNTKAELTEVQEATIQGKSIEMLQALAASKTLTHDKAPMSETQRPNNASQRELEWIKSAGVAATDSVAVMEAVSTVLRASAIERERQAFRYRMNKFNENAKAFISSGWVMNDKNLSESAVEIKPYITVRRFVAEAPELKEYFGQLKTESPIATPAFKKSLLTHDSLTTAAIVTEVGSMWAALKKGYYNKKPLESKFVALETMLDAIPGYKRLCSAMKNNRKAVRVIEGFQYRLESLKDRVENHLNSKYEETK